MGSELSPGGESKANLHHHVAELIAGFLERSPALVGFKALDGRYIFANTELERAFGAEPGCMLGSADYDFMSRSDAEDLIAKDKAVVASGQAARSLDQVSTARCGRLSLAAVRFPREDEHGGVIGVGYVAIDVSSIQGEEGEAIAELESAQRRIAELREAIDNLKAETSIDPLTGAWNRPRLEESIQFEMQRFRRYGHQASLLFLDIDYFKQINDTLGHPSGDNVLRQVVRLIRANLRSTDQFGRWGGDEFLLLLPDTDLTSARLLAEKIRGALIKPDTSDFVLVSGSFGIASCERCETWEDWVACADAAMYVAKKNGRNRVEVGYGKAEAVPGAGNPGRNFVHLIWHPSYECGHAVIDKQHRGLFEGANSLISAMIDQWPAKEIKEILDCLMGDVTEHFASEEAVLRAAEYRGLEDHLRIHARLLARARDFSRRFVQGEDVIGEAFHFMVYEIIAQHILAEDRKFFMLLRQLEESHASA